MNASKANYSFMPIEEKVEIKENKLEWKINQFPGKSEASISISLPHSIQIHLLSIS